MQNLGLGVVPGTRNVISSRALLTPNLVIDDHFSVKSQWSLLTSPNFTPNATTALGVGQGAYVLGDPRTTALLLNRAWLEWTSDIGVLRLGRMPVAWGFGLVYDAGNNVWDDFQTTFDRLEYRLHLGYVVGGIAYSKGRKLSTLDNQNDQQFYVAFLQYNNPEIEVEGGVLLEKQERAAVQQSDLMTGSANPYTVPAGGTAPPLSNRVAWPLNNHFIDVYLKKTSGKLSFGAEVGWFGGTATDYGANGADEMNALAGLANISLNLAKAKGFLEVMYVGGDADLTDNSLTGFTPLNRNRRPGLILGRELLGPYHSGGSNLGSPVYYGNNGTFSGLLSVRPGFRMEWSTDVSSSVELIYAQKMVTAGDAMDLGVEVDVGTEYKVYKNFTAGATVGYLFPGAGLQTAGNGSGVFAVRGTAVVSF